MKCYRRALVVAVSFVTSTILGTSRADVLAIYATTTNGPDGISDFYAINPVTGAATLVGSTAFQRISGIEFGADGVLYGTAERNDGSDTAVLITINPATGLGTEVGPTGITGAVADLAFRADGTLFAYDAQSAEHRLATIDTSTGAATVLGSTGISVDGGNGIEFFSGTLYHIARDNGLSTLNQTTGAASLGTTVTYVGGGISVVAMDRNPVSGVIYAVVQLGEIGNPARRLATVDIGTATVTSYADTIDRLDAITLPEPQPSAILLFSLGLAAIGGRWIERLALG